MERIDAKYVFLDIVDYTSKTIETQAAIIVRLQEIVKKAIEVQYSFGWNVKYLPTGDGMCIVLENEKDDDKHLQIALSILKILHSHNHSAKNKFDIRIGVNENKDIVYTDINGRRNYAGRGINYAQRVMSIAEEGQVMVGIAVHEKLADTDKYFNHFVPLRVMIKRNKELNVFQYVDDECEYINSGAPKSYGKQ